MLSSQRGVGLITSDQPSRQYFPRLRYERPPQFPLPPVVEVLRTGKAPVLDIPSAGGLMKPTARGLLVLAAGIALTIWGASYCLQSWTRIFGAGVVLIGVGIMSFGITSGYADYGRNGTFLYRIGVFGFMAGLAAGGYVYYYGILPI